MNLKELSEIINAPMMADDFKKRAIISSLAKDKDAMTDILEILAEERAMTRELVTDMNSELSRAHIFIDEINPKLLGKKENQTNLGERFTKEFVCDKIAEFYVKYKYAIRHCYNRFN